MDWSEQTIDKFNIRCKSFITGNKYLRGHTCDWGEIITLGADNFVHIKLDYMSSHYHEKWITDKALEYCAAFVNKLKPTIQEFMIENNLPTRPFTFRFLIDNKPSFQFLTVENEVVYK
ncbi:hypothetical protein [Pedobacter cryoconitis]|uniref:hypothetical protein n=1 Tax=Pedobacter cryoconitis TaxID=188932 RepID=UPI000DB9C693|nr:hypothetical protein [Pedobacter cryoconitis]